MKLKFYKYGGTPNRIDKSNYITQIGEVSGVNMKEATNVMKPVFILDTNPIVYNSNYFYCDTTQRYYYINNITAMSGGRIAIDGEIDVLFTYKDEIYASPAWVEKSGINNDALIEFNNKAMHNDLPFEQFYDIIGQSFPYNPLGDYTGSGRNCVITFIS